MGEGMSFTLNPGFYWEPTLVLEISGNISEVSSEL